MSDFNPDEINSLVADLRKSVESKNAETGETKEKIKKIEAKLDQYEDANQKLVKEIAEKTKKELELEEKYKDLERHLYTMPNTLAVQEKSDRMKAFEKYCIKGQKHLTETEQKYLRTDNSVDGGYLCPPEYVGEITKAITEISPIRSVARIRTTSTPRMIIPKRTALAIAYRDGEGDEATESESNYGQTNIKVEKITGYSIASIEALNESAFNLESEINADMALAFAKREGRDFVLGNGAANNEPEGFLNAPGIQEINSGLAADISFNSLIKITGQLKTGYKPIYGFNRKTRAEIMLKVDGVGRYLWQAGNVAAGIPNTINGYSYLELPDMPNIGAGNYPVIFADFTYYSIVDHTMMLMIRDDTTLAHKGKVRFILHRFNGGAVELEEAFAKIKCSA